MDIGIVKNNKGILLDFEGKAVKKVCDLIGLIRIELRRGLPLGTFPYTSISRANADKKALLKFQTLFACQVYNFDF